MSLTKAAFFSFCNSTLKRLPALQLRGFFIVLNHSYTATAIGFGVLKGPNLVHKSKKMQQPGSNGSANQSDNKQAAILNNNLKPSKDFVVTIASDGTGYNGNINLCLAPGLVPGNTALMGVAAKAVDNSHVTLTAPEVSAVAAEVAAYIERFPMHITGIEITTSDTDNFKNGNMLVIGAVDTDGSAANKSQIRFNKYQVSNGSGGILDTIQVDDVDFTTGGNFQMILKSLKLSTSMTFRFFVAGTATAKVIVSR